MKNLCSLQRKEYFLTILKVFNRSSFYTLYPLFVFHFYLDRFYSFHLFLVVISLTSIISPTFFNFLVSPHMRNCFSLIYLDNYIYLYLSCFYLYILVLK